MYCVSNQKVLHFLYIFIILQNLPFLREKVSIILTIYFHTDAGFKGF